MNNGAFRSLGALVVLGGIISNAALAAPSEASKADLDSDVRSFCSDAIKTVGSFGFADYKLRIENMKPFFSPEGWTRQEKAFEQSKSVDLIVQDKIVQVTEPNSAGCSIVDRDVKGNGAKWTAHANAVRTFQAPDSPAREIPVEITMHLAKPAGGKIQIESWVE